MSGAIVKGDRRSYRRYQCRLDLRVQSAEQSGIRHLGDGSTVDFSRRCLRFETDDPPQPGTPVEVHLAWPFLLQNICRLELIVRGTITDITERGTLLRIGSYEFRTCGERSFSEPLPPGSMVRFA